MTKGRKKSTSRRRKYFGPGADALLTTLKDAIAALPAFETAALEALYKETAEKLGVKGGDLIHPTRLAISGIPFGPGLFELMVALGKETVQRRLGAAVQAVKSGNIKTAVTV